MSFNGLSIEVVQWSCYLEKLYSRTHSAINCRYYTPEDINDLKEKFERIEHQKKEDEESLQNMELYWKVQVARIVPGASCTDCEEDELDEAVAGPASAGEASILLAPLQAASIGKRACIFLIANHRRTNSHLSPANKV